MFNKKNFTFLLIIFSLSAFNTLAMKVDPKLVKKIDAESALNKEFFDAIRAYDLQKVKNLLKAHGSKLIDFVNKYGETPFFVACNSMGSTSNPEEIKAILEEFLKYGGSKLTYVIDKDFDQTPLMALINWGLTDNNISLTELLLKNGADKTINHVRHGKLDIDDKNILLMAFDRTHIAYRPKTIKMLVKYGADLNTVPKEATGFSVFPELLKLRNAVTELDPMVDTTSKEKFLNEMKKKYEKDKDIFPILTERYNRKYARSAMPFSQKAITKYRDVSFEFVEQEQPKYVKLPSGELKLKQPTRGKKIETPTIELKRGEKKALHKKTAKSKAKPAVPGKSGRPNVLKKTETIAKKTSTMQQPKAKQSKKDLMAPTIEELIEDID